MSGAGRSMLPLRMQLWIVNPVALLIRLAPDRARARHGPRHGWLRFALGLGSGGAPASGGGFDRWSRRAGPSGGPRARRRFRLGGARIRPAECRADRPAP